MDTGALDFSLETTQVVEVQVVESAIAPDLSTAIQAGWEWMFEGGSHSLVALCVGGAEGTRRADGGFNKAYQGHTDPGNQVWNLGTFSYQHGASSVEEADQKQLARLHRQVAQQQQQAADLGLELTLEQTLNGADLANQSPTSGLGHSTSRGYIPLLVDATLSGQEGDSAIHWARVASYLFPRSHPRAGQWNAPGLGNTRGNVERDQQRRMDRCNDAIAAWKANSLPAPGLENLPVVEQEVEQTYGALSFEFP